MKDLLEVLEKYPLGVILLAGIVFSALYILKVIIDKHVADTVALINKPLELALTRRSSFEEKVLSDRYARIIDLTSRLQSVTTNLNRKHNGEAVAADFLKGKEVVPLTAIFEDLAVYRLVLTERFYDLINAKAKLALRIANASDTEWETLGEAWLQQDDELRRAVDAEFGLSKITWGLADTPATRA